MKKVGYPQTIQDGNVAWTADLIETYLICSTTIFDTAEVSSCMLPSNLGQDASHCMIFKAHFEFCIAY